MQMNYFLLMIYYFTFIHDVKSNGSGEILMRNESAANIVNEELYNVSKMEIFRCENPITDCSNAGVCNNEKDECICFEGYKTVFLNVEDYFSYEPRCNYKLKKQIYAMVLALFISFGFLHLYLGNYIIGYIQMILFFIIFVFNIYMIVNLSLKHVKKVSRLEYKNSLALMIVICFFSLIFFFWYLFDIFMVLFNIYRDSNNVDLYTFIS
jgi:hypothetical protein